MKITAGAAILAIFAAWAAEASAQDRGRGEFGYFRRSVRWYPNLNAAMGRGGASEDPDDPFNRARRFFGQMERGEKKFILVYVRPAGEAEDPNSFSDQNIVRASFEEWAFVKVDFDRDNAELKRWRVSSVPSLIGLDLHGNDFVKVRGASTAQVRGVLKKTPEMIAAYQAKLDRDFRKAVDSMKSDESRGISAFRDIVEDGKKGYKQVDESKRLLEEHSRSAFTKAELAESVSLDIGIDYLEDLAKIYKATPQGVRAEIRIAELEHHRGNDRDAVTRLKKVLKYNSPTLEGELAVAQQRLDEYSK